MRELVARQRKYFYSNATKSIDFRIKMLERLRVAIELNEKSIYRALKEDLNKSEFETYITEVHIVKSEIKTAINKLYSLSRPKRVPTPITHFPSSSYIISEPYGVALILAPWNYPFQLAMSPLVGAIAAGNCAIVKPSRTSKNTSKVIEKILEQTFKHEYVSCVPKEVDNKEILEQNYDFIFFTGSEKVGKTVMEAASKHVTPLVLELGGKSPCIVDKNSNIEIAARRIVWGKFLNAGQTCIAPDYVLVDHEVKSRFTKALTKYINIQYKNALFSKHYGKIINKEHFDRLTSYIKNTQDLIGGNYDKESLRIEPTIFPNAEFTDEIMKGEIFGPILPIIEYKDIDKTIHTLKHMPKPLALYVFSDKKDFQNKVINSVSSGGVCINDVIMHVANENLPFGGIGSSGMGNYHGVHSFKTFSHERAVLANKSYLDIPLRYPPYSDRLLKIIKGFLG